MPCFHLSARQVLAGLACSSIGAAAIAQQPSVPGYRLVWTEEFSGSTVSPTRWNFENVAWPYNGEAQFYLPQNASASGGLLRIRAERQTFGGRQYTSARINTDNKFEQQFGRFEARMKVPAGRGYWPAFWLLPASGAWPPEIDVMEILGHQTSTVYMTQHFGPTSAPANNGGSFTGPDFAADFHDFAVEWSPSRIDWFVDGVLRFSTTTNVPQEPMYVVLNLAVGGFWPGYPDASTVFPQNMLVDWVRVYSRDEPLANPSFETLNASAPASWQLFGNAQSSTTGATTGTRSVRAFGVGGAGPHYSGAFQSLPASPGQVWRATANLRHLASDRLAGASFVDLKIEWYNRSNQLILANLVTALNPSSPTDTTVPAVVQATAPPNTASARIAIVYAQPGVGSGSVYVDDATFGYIFPAQTTVCVADVNNSGTLDIVDVFEFLNAWFSVAPIADFNRSGDITVQDIFDFLNTWFQGCP
ncbi:MAG: glycoside hydrolase family 16 protein [Phycisphaerales bacterium]|nr:glycoside hydrolase family 16 protein [Phycisphaerales bacterium]